MNNQAAGRVKHEDGHWKIWGVGIRVELKGNKQNL
jgi:hypothetical protein